MSTIMHSRKKFKDVYQVVGVMSGTSLDGLDLAWVRFENTDNRWSYTFHKTATYPHKPEIVALLQRGTSLLEHEIEKLDTEFGAFIGYSILDFLAAENAEIDFIASHGHTLLHQPHKGITLQIGHGKQIHDITGLPTLFNFRQQDVSLGGQGAPLVPIGDRDLFTTYDYCLNLGGIANISYQAHGERIAYDICPVNMALNELSKEVGLPYDNQGQMARSGQINQDLLLALNHIPYLQQKHPKSLGYEDYQEHWQGLLNDGKISLSDRMHTMVIAIVEAIQKQIRSGKEVEILVTGGGAYNTFLMECLRREHEASWHVPDDETVAFKEALIFAYMGLLRFLGKENTLASVTGAKKNTSSGQMVGFGLS